MACCGGTVSWYHCYPEPCPSSDACCCDYPCYGCVSGGQCCGSCGGIPCTKGCNGVCSSTCGKGACCTCNQDQLGFAWVKSSGSCNLAVGCGGAVWFASENCSFTAGATRRDTNGTSSRLADLSPALFEALGHNLNDGIFTAGADTSNSGSYTCPCP